MNDLTKQNKSFRSTLSTLWWSLRLGFQISPFYYSLKFIIWILRPLVPIAQAYVVSLILQELFDILSTDSTQVTERLWTFVAISIAIMIIDSIKDLIDEYQRIRFGLKYTEKVFNIYLNRLGQLDFYYHENPSFLAFKERIKDVLDWRGVAVMNRIPHLLGNFVGVTTVIGIFITINPIFLILLVIPMIINGIINSKFGENIYYIWEWEGENQKEALNAYSSLQDKNTIAEAKIYGFAKYLADKFSRLTNQYGKRISKEANKKTALLSLSVVLERIIFAVIQVWLISQVVSRAITIQAYSFYLQNIQTVNREFDSLQENVTSLFEQVRYMQDFKTFLELPDFVEKPIKGIKLEQVAPEIEFENVRFTYPHSSNEVLKDISFKIKPGEKVALVGRNGAGKTTLIKLLARFYDTNDGEIRINKHNIKSIDLDSYYNLWGILFQNFAKYWFSLRENIGLGNIKDINNDELISKAAEQAGVNSFLSNLQKGYETMLSPEFEGGTDLSGGGWQKVGIARGFFANPKLIVLDEPTSALDAIAEQEVFDQIQQISSDTTMIIVSHRFATVRNADRIIVMNDGMIEQNGSHEELMQQKDSLYYQMFTAQAQGYK